MGLNVGSLFVQSYSGEDAEGLIDDVGVAVTAGTVIVAWIGALVISSPLPRGDMDGVFPIGDAD